MTSWSTSGQYSPVFETSDDIIDLYAIRHVYPITGFNMLLKAYSQSLRTDEPLDIPVFITKYSKQQYGFDQQQAASFFKALTTTPYEVKQGEVIAPSTMTIQQLADSQMTAVKILYGLKPTKNIEEFEHYRLMADIRMLYLNYQKVEKEANMPSFSKAQIPIAIQQLKQLLEDSQKIDQRFIDLNKNTLYMGQLKEENDLRDSKIRLLYQRLTRDKEAG